MVASGTRVVEARHPLPIQTDRGSDYRIRFLQFAGGRIKNLRRPVGVVIVVSANGARNDQVAVAGRHDGGEEIPFRWNGAQTLSSFRVVETDRRFCPISGRLLKTY